VWRHGVRPETGEPTRGLGPLRASGFPALLLCVVALGVAFGVGSIALSGLLGPRRPTPEKQAPYECGMPPVGDARERHSIKFYLVAMIFLLFDIEVAFLYPWALAIRDLRWMGFFQLLVFLAILAAGYVYIWRKRALDWDKS
jgi:NADH-quinone oxidoreductase subunit A